MRRKLKWFKSRRSSFQKQNSDPRKPAKKAGLARDAARRKLNPSYSRWLETVGHRQINQGTFVAAAPTHHPKQRIFVFGRKPGIGNFAITARVDFVLVTQIEI